MKAEREPEAEREAAIFNFIIHASSFIIWDGTADL
jgi:hypothetical protein